MSKLSIMLKKEQGKTREFSMSYFSFIIILTLICLFPFVCVAGFWLHLQQNQEKIQLTANIDELETELEHKEKELGRLLNLEAFLQKTAPNLLSLSLTDIENEDVNPEKIDEKAEISPIADNATNTKPEPETEVKPQEVQAVLAENVESVQKQTEPLTTPIETSIETSIEIPIETQIERTSKGPDVVTQSSVSAQAKEVVTEPKVEDAKIEQPDVISNTNARNINQDLVSISGASVTYAAPSISIAYTLRNANRRKELSGEQYFTLINFERGKLVRTPLTDTNVKAFNIKNFREIRTKILIQGHVINPRARLQIDIVKDGEIVFRDSYPVRR